MKKYVSEWRGLWSRALICYDKRVFKILLLILIFCPYWALASVLFNQPVLPYEPNVLDSTSGNFSFILGSLVGDPQLFEFSLEATTTINLRLSQSGREELSPLVILLVKVEPFNRGVSEVGRVATAVTDWSPERFSALGLTLKSNEKLTTKLAPGQYRFEVSSPDNNVVYLLRYQVGTSVEPSLSLMEAYEIRRFLGYYGFTIIFSGRVLWPAGVIVILLGIAWVGYSRYRRLNQNNYV